jgi:hypothetical protein
MIAKLRLLQWVKQLAIKRKYNKLYFRGGEQKAENMSKPKIIKGQYRYVSGLFKHYIHIVNGKAICNMVSGVGRETDNTGELFADAANTFLKCEKMPSELLKENEWLKELIKKAVCR